MVQAEITVNTVKHTTDQIRNLIIGGYRLPADAEIKPGSGCIFRIYKEDHMASGLDVIIVDDEPDVCKTLSALISSFYTWGNVIDFTDADQAIEYCLNRDVGIAIFVVDVYLGGKSGFFFLDAIEEKFITAHEDTIIISGKASDEIVDMCVASNVNHLLEKPIKPFALQLAIRAIIEKYLRFAKKLLQDPVYAENVAQF